MFWPLWAFGHNFVQNRPIALILISFDSARRALLNELSFAYSNFLPQKWAYSPPTVFRFLGTYISVHRHFRTRGVVPFDSARRDESNSICFESNFCLRCATVYPEFFARDLLENYRVFFIRYFFYFNEFFEMLKKFIDNPLFFCFTKCHEVKI